MWKGKRNIIIVVRFLFRLEKTNHNKRMSYHLAAVPYQTRLESSMVFLEHGFLEYPRGIIVTNYGNFINR